MSRAEKLSRVLLSSGLVETVSIQPVRRSGNDSESHERHFAANIFLVEGVDGALCYLFPVFGQILIVLRLE
jgi:hypothetical protein